MKHHKLEDLLALAERCRWRRLMDEKPEVGVMVLYFDQEKDLFIGEYRGRKDIPIDHIWWCYGPELPKEED